MCSFLAPCRSRDPAKRPFVHCLADVPASLLLCHGHRWYFQTGSEYGFNRLSRFQYDASSAETTRNSEEILLESSDKFYEYHSGGWVGFKPSAYESANVSFGCD